MKLFAGINGDTDLENRITDTVDGRRKERVGWTERETWKLTLPYVKYTANGNLLYDSGNSKAGSVIIKKGEMGREMAEKFKRRGTYVYLWLRKLWELVINRKAWRAAIHGVTKSWTLLSD